MSTVPPSSAPVIRVLIADDSPETAQATAQLIELGLPCEMAIAYDGLQALQQAEGHRPNALILDLHMPGLDGLEVARRVRQRYGTESPYIIALTGRPDRVTDLPAIDRNFDRAFAKPLDIDQLIAALARLAAGNVGAARGPVPVDLGELFTRAVRQVVPVALDRGLSFSFDCRGPTLIVEDDPIQVHCGLHRLLLALVDLLQSGVVLFHAEATLEPSGASLLRVNAAGTGQLRLPGERAAVIDRLGLLATSTPTRGSSELPSACGVCPNTGAGVHFAGDLNEGVLLRTELRHARAIHDDNADRPVCPPGCHVWIVDASPIGAAALAQRLQRLGWVTRTFVSCAAALAATPPAGGRWHVPAPSLLVVDETGGELVTHADELQQRLPPSAQRLYMAPAGSPTLGLGGDAAGYQLHVLPLSPLELCNACAMAAPEAGSRFGSINAAGRPPAPRPRVLIVDDNEINRIVGEGLVEALGYEVDTAHDGLDAIDQCRIMPPQLVLMDLDMPVLNGIDATLRLRELQRLGNVAPFFIVAATADATPRAEAACRRAGMDGFLAKPLRLDALREALRRYVAPQ